MFKNITFSEKQQEYFDNAYHRWNFKTGATRSGKTFMDYFLIPKRIFNVPEGGNIVIIGNSRQTIERNVIDPMKNGWGGDVIGDIQPKGAINLFGRKAWVFGADNKKSVDAIRGMSIDYCYGDEVATWHESVFDILKSRLDKETSRFDGTCNPERPQHWVKKFIDKKDIDVYSQAYTIDDNPFLADATKNDLKLEYRGTVLYDRYILGKWAAAEGSIYTPFANDTHRHYLNTGDIDINDIIEINIGVDFGGNGSQTAFVATAITSGYKRFIVLKSERFKSGNVDSDILYSNFRDFVLEIYEQYGRLDYAYCDSMETILINSLKNGVAKDGIPIRVRNATKSRILDRIHFTNMLINRDVLFYTEQSETLKTALCEAVWKENKENTAQKPDERLDDGTSDIDTLDAFEYTIENEYNRYKKMNWSK